MEGRWCNFSTLQTHSRASCSSQDLPRGDATPCRWFYFRLDWESEVHPIRLAQTSPVPHPPTLKFVLCLEIHQRPHCHIQVLSFHLGPLAPDAEWPPSSWYSPPGIIWFVVFWFFSPFSCPFCLLFPLPFLNVGIPQGSLCDALSPANATLQSLVSSSNSNLPLLAPLHPSLTPER